MQLITLFVASKVALWMRALKHHELVSLFNRYNALPSTRRMSGDAFEVYCHTIFSTRIEFDMVDFEFSGSQSQELEVLRATGISLDSVASLNVNPSHCRLRLE